MRYEDDAMGLVKTATQIGHIRKLAVTISEILAESIGLVRPGLSTRELDAAIEAIMARRGVNGPCKGYEGFPAVSCISVNEVVTHGKPDGRVLALGDIVDIDLVIEKGGFFADVSKTVAVGRLEGVALRLVTMAEECLEAGLAVVRPGATLGDIGFAVQSRAEGAGFSVVREFCGHFIGTDMHEGPPVLNYGRPGTGLRLEPGMILCVEPMINEGRRAITVDPDGWNTRTRDGKLSSRCEHMVLVTENGHEVLTRHPRELVVEVR